MNNHEHGLRRKKDTQSGPQENEDALDGHLHLLECERLHTIHFFFQVMSFPLNLS
jgi:hypothetical protein